MPPIPPADVAALTYRVAFLERVGFSAALLKIEDVYRYTLHRVREKFVDSTGCEGISSRWYAGNWCLDSRVLSSRRLRNSRLTSRFNHHRSRINVIKESSPPLVDPSHRFLNFFVQSPQLPRKRAMIDSQTTVFFFLFLFSSPFRFGISVPSYDTFYNTLNTGAYGVNIETNRGVLIRRRKKKKKKERKNATERCCGRYCWEDIQPTDGICFRAQGQLVKQKNAAAAAFPRFTLEFRTNEATFFDRVTT